MSIVQSISVSFEEWLAVCRFLAIWVQDLKCAIIKLRSYEASTVELSPQQPTEGEMLGLGLILLHSWIIASKREKGRNPTKDTFAHELKSFRIDNII